MSTTTRHNGLVCESLCQIPDGTPYWGVGRFLDQPFSQYSITTISVTQHEGRIPYHPFWRKRLVESILRYDKAVIGGTWWTSILLRHFMLAFPLNCPPSIQNHKSATGEKKKPSKRLLVQSNWKLCLHTLAAVDWFQIVQLKHNQWLKTEHRKRWA